MSTVDFTFRIAFSIFVSVFGTSLRAEQPSVPAAQIAAGKSVWVDSKPGDALLNARVDIGVMRQIADEIEISLQWPVTPGFRNDLRFKEPELQVPQGSAIVDRERVVCKPDGTLSYAVESAIVAPDGKRLHEQKLDAAAERKRAESRRSVDRYGPNPRSLVCWAAARKCEGKPFIWPPPPNTTPLEHSARATAMNAAYNERFIPNCKL